MIHFHLQLWLLMKVIKMERDNLGIVPDRYHWSPPLPVEIALLPSLESLNVACNNITTISPLIGSMQRLKNLNICRNMITHLPDGMPLNGTTYLAVNTILLIVWWKSTSCELLSNPELWQAPSLEQLFASANELRTLSPEVGCCQTLRKLHLDWNQISSLPPQLTNLTHLTELSLCGNALCSLPNGE